MIIPNKIWQKLKSASALFRDCSRPWIEAENKCQSYGGNLVHIMNEQEQKDFNQWHIGKVHNKDDDWMNEKWAGSWIGLTDIYSGD